MTTKEKAQELFNKFRQFAHHDTSQIGSYQLQQEMYNAKQCALIVVDEILNLDSGDAVDKNYWQEVKQEINKL